MNTTDLVYAPVSELSSLIRARKVSPVELTRACLERAQALDPKLHAWAALTPEPALEEARRAEAEIARGHVRGPLHGIPYGAKDLLATRGVPTTWGAKPYAGQRFEHDAAVVRRLREAGAVLMGKLAMIELAGGLGYSKGSASLTGAARNPWDTSRWTCGSSSGAGAAVASGMVPFAIGSETWGSIVCPSSFCGVSGLRPTFGRVSRDGAMALSWSLDKLGPMARSARDCEIVLRAIAGHDPDDPYSSPEPAGPESDPKAVRAYRLGYLSLDFDKSGDASVGMAFHRALVALGAAGLKVEEITLPDLPFEAATSVILNAEVGTAFEELERDGRAGELASPGARLSFVTGRAVRGSDYVKAQRIRTVCQRAMADLLSRYDAILFPGEMHTAFGAEQDFSEIPWSDPAGAAGNLCGLPALSVPCGFGDGALPAGLAIMTAAFEEARGVGIGRFYQGITDWHTLRPPVDQAA